jgi:hypothetical protein
MEGDMGLFDFFKTPKSQPISAKAYEEQFSEIVKEIRKCYHGFFTDMSKLLEKCSDRNARATRIGLEIPMIAYFDFENFSNLLFNNMHLEIKDKRNVFFQEQCTFYVLFSDRYLFSKLGNEGRNQVMEVLERAYLNKILNTGMTNFTNHNVAAKMCHIYEKHILEREKETAQLGSLLDFSTFHSFTLIYRLGLESKNDFVKFLLNEIIVNGTMEFTIQALSTL